MSRAGLRIIFVLAVLFTTKNLLAQEVFPFRGKVTEDKVNIRIDTTVSSEVIYQADKNTILIVNKELYDWYRVSLPNSAPCYIHKDYVQVTSNNKGLVSGDKVNVRLRPDIGSAILGKVANNEIVNIVSAEKDWYKIEPPQNSSGWIHKSFIRKAPAIEVAQKLEDKDKYKDEVEARAEEKDQIYEGLIEAPEKFLFWSGKYRLINDTGDTYLLKDDVNNLGDFAGKKVKIIGRRILNYSGKFPLINVSAIEVLK